MRASHWITVSIFAAALVGFAGPARGARGVSPSSLGLRLAPTQRNNPNEQAAADALRQVSRAQTQLARLHVQRRRDFEESTRYTEALEATRRARSAFDELRGSVLLDLRGSSEYKSAQLAIWKLQEQLIAAQKQQGKAKLATQLARELLKQRNALSALETQLLASDERIAPARNELIDAEAVLAGRNHEFVESIRRDPDWRDARTQLDEARSRLAAVGG